MDRNFSFTAENGWRIPHTRGDGPVRMGTTITRLDASYVHRFMRITLLRPDIIEDLLHNREPEGMSIEKLRQIPEIWAEQDEAFRLSE